MNNSIYKNHHNKCYEFVDWIKELCSSPRESGLPCDRTSYPQSLNNTAAQSGSLTIVHKTLCYTLVLPSATAHPKSPNRAAVCNILSLNLTPYTLTGLKSVANTSPLFDRGTFLKPRFEKCFEKCSSPGPIWQQHSFDSQSSESEQFKNSKCADERMQFPCLEWGQAFFFANRAFVQCTIVHTLKNGAYWSSKQYKGAFCCDKRSSIRPPPDCPSKCYEWTRWNIWTLQNISSQH